ncbi:MAG: four helix bundle protein [Bacteroidales bacterium]|jgi:four helix bundle protein|nr:four helix bundle protein [Bacteroidales bacterium]
MKVSHFEDLEVWKEARVLSQLVFKLTSCEKFSKEFGLKNQIRNASGSVMDCIAEGFEREGNKEFFQFLSISKGSCGETRSQAYRAFDYHLISETDLNQLIETTTRLSKKNSSLYVLSPNKRLQRNQIQITNLESAG